MIFLTAFFTGLLGSFHCAGMCGPIALATPTVPGYKWLSKLVYNFGRLITYAVMGALLGAFGLGLKLAGMQQWVSIIAGILIILSVVFTSHWLSSKIKNPFSFFQGNTITQLFRTQKISSLLLIGLLNGLLPCGFVYIGLIGSVATQGIAEGALFMFLFGLGTFPMMFAISMLGQFLKQTMRARINKFTPYFAVLIGCLFILRGLNLGIPYISPKVSNQQNTVQDCCKPE